MQIRNWMAGSVAVALAAAGVVVTASPLQTTAKPDEHVDAHAEAKSGVEKDIASDVESAVERAMRQAERGLAQLRVMGRPRLGITTRDVTAEEARTAGLDGPTGAYVVTVTPDSAAARAGLAEKDILVAVDGETVRSSRHLSRVIGETPDGRTMPLTYVRDGSRRTASVQLTASASAAQGIPGFEWDGDGMMRTFEFPDPKGGGQAFSFTPGSGAFLFRRGRLGIVAQPVRGQLAEYFGVTTGVLVTEVTADGPAAKAGIKAGDVITAVGDKRVADTGDILAAIGDSETASSVTLSITRERRQQSVTVQVPARASTSREKRVVIRQRATV